MSKSAAKKRKRELFEANYKDKVARFGIGGKNALCRECPGRLTCLAQCGDHDAAVANPLSKSEKNRSKGARIKAVRDYIGSKYPGPGNNPLCGGCPYAGDCTYACSSRAIGNRNPGRANRPDPDDAAYKAAADSRANRPGPDGAGTEDR